MFSLHKVLKDISTKIVNAITTIGQHTSTLTTLSNLINTINTNGVRLEQRTLLWTNPNPTANFYQNISVNLNGYDDLVIEYLAGSAQQQHNEHKAPVGTRGILYGIRRDNDTTCYIGVRGFTSSTSRVDFSHSGYMTSITGMYSVDSYCIPQKIYGIKYINVGG